MLRKVHAEEPSGMMAGDTSCDRGWSGCAKDGRGRRLALGKTADGLPVMDGHRVLLGGESCDGDNESIGLGGDIKVPG